VRRLVACFDVRRVTSFEDGRSHGSTAIEGGWLRAERLAAPVVGGFAMILLYGA
jgi:hypothetical protein